MSANENHSVRKVLRIGDLLLIPLDSRLSDAYNIDENTFLIEKPIEGGIFLQLKTFNNSCKEEESEV